MRRIRANVIRLRRRWVIGGSLLLVLGLTLVATQLSAGSPGSGRTYHAGAAIVTVYEQSHSRGVMVTSGGWAY
jgi:hypothetical protein